MEKQQKRPLIHELTQGQELANQLKNHLDKTMAPETCELLLEKILSSYENALSMLNWRGADLVDSKPTVSSDQLKKNVCKKRKTMEKWSDQVKVCSGTMVEVSLRDGYSWRKYGQKDILGANHPRAYYRCTHRHVRGCLATKQVQRSDQDPTLFEVTYKRRHTCIEETGQSKALASKEEKETVQDSKQERNYMVLKHGCGFEGAENGEEEIFPLFSFPLTPIESENLGDVFFVGCDSPDFVSAARNMQSSDSDLTKMINSATNSATNSPMGNWDFSIDHVDFNTGFPLDITDSEMFF